MMLVSNYRVIHKDSTENGSKRATAKTCGSYPSSLLFPYRLCPIQGTIEITNRRNEPIMLHLTSAMVGVVDLDKKLIADCDVPPKTQTLIPSDREYAPNNVARLYWEILLQPGEKKTITIKSSRWLFGQ